MAETPVTITKEKLQKIREHINKKFSVFIDGKIDYDKCQLNVAYAISDHYVNYNGILLLEKHKLATIESQLKLVRAIAYDEIKMGKIKYDINAKGMDIMLEGHEKVREKQLEYNKQKDYVDFWENIVNQIGYYAKNVEVIFKRVELAKYGE